MIKVMNWLTTTMHKVKSEIIISTAIRCSLVSALFIECLVNSILPSFEQLEIAYTKEWELDKMADDLK